MPGNVVDRSDLWNMYHCILKSKMRMQDIIQFLAIGWDSALQYRCRLVLKPPVVGIEKRWSDVGRTSC